MNAVLTAHLMETPGAVRLLDRLRDDFASRISLLLLIPSSVDMNIISMAIHDKLAHYFDITEVDLTRLDTMDMSGTLGQTLEAEGRTDGSPRTLSALMTASGLPDVIHLSGFEKLDIHSQEAWRDFLLEWSKAMPSLINQSRRPPSLCFPLYAQNLVVAPAYSELFLKVRWWWGVPSACDVHLLCRLEHLGSEERLLSQWREHLLPALAGSDIDFADYLWDRLETSFEDFVESCKEFARMRGWTPSCLEAWNCHSVTETIHTRIAPLHYLPERNYSLWARGVLTYTPESGLELHTAVLAALNLDNSLRHRFWRGQVALLFPVIDGLRLKICRILTDTYGTGWPLRWYSPQNDWEQDAVVSNPTTCELGHLKYLLRSDELRLERRFLSVVSHAHSIRSRLAHYEFVSFDDYRRLYELMDELQNFQERNHS